MVENRELIANNRTKKDLRSFSEWRSVKNLILLENNDYTMHTQWLSVPSVERGEWEKNIYRKSFSMCVCRPGGQEEEIESRSKPEKNVLMLKLISSTSTKTKIESENKLSWLCIDFLVVFSFSLSLHFRHSHYSPSLSFARIQRLQIYMKMIDSSIHDPDPHCICYIMCLSYRLLWQRWNETNVGHCFCCCRRRRRRQR